MELLPLARLKGRMEARNDFQNNLVLKCQKSNYQCGNACIPRNKKCRLSEEQLEKIVHKIEDQIKDLPTERGLVIAPDGRIIVHKQGDQTSVYFNWMEINAMKGAIVTHNHPNLGWSENDARSKGLSFSSADLRLAAMGEVKEMRAVSHGYRHSLKPPLSGWNERFWQEKIEPTYNKHEKEVYREIGAKVISGQISVDKADVAYHHEVIRRTSEELGMIYKREEIKV